MAKKPKFRDEDLFKDSTMTFGEHLEELRRCLFKALAGLFVGLVIVLAFNWAEWAVRFMQRPLQAALQQYYLKQADKRVEREIEQLKKEGIPVSSAETYREAINTDHMTPQYERVYVPEILQTLREVHGITLPIDAGAFSPTEFLNAKDFCQQVYEGREQAEGLSAWLWGRFSPASQQLIGDIAQGKTDPDRNQVAKLAAELAEKVLAKNDLYAENKAFFDGIAADRPSRFRQWIDPTSGAAERAKKADAVTNLVAQLEAAQTADGQPARYREINRKLLAVVYPQAIAANPRYASMLAITLWRHVTDDPRVGIKTLSSQENFIIWMKAALLLALIVASPWVFWQIWTFVAAGLYPHEKNFVYSFLPFSLILFVAGAALCFFLVFQYVLEFLLRFNEWMGTEPDLRLNEWLGFALFMPLGFGVAFQLPLVMLFLQRIGVMTVSSYLAKWRMAVLVIAFSSAILTPSPDPYSMMLMCGPLVALYFGGILLCKYVPKRRSPFDEEATEGALAT